MMSILLYFQPNSYSELLQQIRRAVAVLARRTLRTRNAEELVCEKTSTVYHTK
uniref:Uncharacterized protein n=1 Tax=Arundo donax TaxID=35708 RepID=A0A0A8XTN8_ARUDO